MLGSSRALTATPNLHMQQPATPRIADADILSAARQLPGANPSAPRILAALSASDTSTGDILALLKVEPALTARVLRVANSALYGLRGGVATLRQALDLLGLDAVRAITAAACFNRSMSRPGAKDPIELTELHTHCIATALAAEALAHIRHKPLAGKAFIAGLLHDFGALLALGVQSAPARHLRLEAGPPTDATDFLADVAAWHEHYGAVVLKSWGLPEALQTAAAHHHDARLAPPIHAELTALVHVADCVTRNLGFGFETEREQCAPLAETFALLAFGAEDVDDIAAALPQRVNALVASLAD